LRDGNSYKEQHKRLELQERLKKRDNARQALQPPPLSPQPILDWVKSWGYNQSADEHNTMFCPPDSTDITSGESFSDTSRLDDLTTSTGDEMVSVLGEVPGVDQYHAFETPMDNKQIAEFQAKQAAAAVAATTRYPFLKRNHDGTAALKRITLTKTVGEWKEAWNAYHYPTLGTQEFDFPNVIEGETVQNNAYTQICTTSTLARVPLLPQLFLTVEDIKSEDKVQAFITVCTRYDLHPFMRWSMIDHRARKQITLACDMRRGDARNDWLNWANVMFMDLYRIFCGALLLDTRGSSATANTQPQLQSRVDKWSRVEWSI
jgi:hypothetical protein